MNVFYAIALAIYHLDVGIVSRQDDFVVAIVTYISYSNYINFNFRGGAAEPIRKIRRAKIIAKILERLNFSVNHVTDNVFATIRKVPSESILNLLSEIGRLMGAVRNVDATLINDDYINEFVEAFLSGDPAPALRFSQEQDD